MMWIAVILLCVASYPSNGARMLGVLGTDSKSRYANMRNLADELVSRGHEVCSIIFYSKGGSEDVFKPRQMMTLLRLLRALINLAAIARIGFVSSARR